MARKKSSSEEERRRGKAIQVKTSKNKGGAKRQEASKSRGSLQVFSMNI